MVYKPVSYSLQIITIGDYSKYADSKDSIE